MSAINAGLAAHDSAQRGPYVQIDPSVAGAYRYVVACRGWRLPQRPPWSIPRLV